MVCLTVNWDHSRFKWITKEKKRHFTIGFINRTMSIHGTTMIRSYSDQPFLFLACSPWINSFHETLNLTIFLFNWAHVLCNFWIESICMTGKINVIITPENEIKILILYYFFYVEYAFSIWSTPDIVCCSSFYQMSVKIRPCHNCCCLHIPTILGLP